MGLLESIGGLAIMAIVFVLFLRYIVHKNDSLRERKKMIANNDRCQELLYEYKQSEKSGKPIMTRVEFEEKISKIIKDPKEKQRALKNIQAKEDRQMEISQWLRNQRKVGYKYQTEIFEMFDEDRELPRKELLSKIETKFNVSRKQAKKLLKKWRENNLVQLCSWNQNNCEVGRTLTSSSRSIDEDDLTRDKWIKNNGKKLKPKSKEYLEWTESYGSLY